MLWSVVEHFYRRTPLARLMSATARAYAALHAPFMVYGYVDPATRKFRRYTRISSSASVIHRAGLAIADHVWVGHYSMLDASEGLTIDEGVQISPWVGVFTHGSESSVRLLGPQYVHVPAAERPGYTRGPIRIGAYSYIGAGAVVLPGVQIGRGCLIGAGTIVTADVPDHSIVVGQPGRVRGNTLERDARRFGMTETYYDAQALKDSD
jgi:acetyltransferase-like isoleucine patch superfamily enzyme